MEAIQNYRELKVYRLAFTSTLSIFEACNSFPETERIQLTAMLCNTATKLNALIAEAWIRRGSQRVFAALLIEAAGLAAHIMSLLDLAYKLRYIKDEQHELLCHDYEDVIAMLDNMSRNPVYQTR